MRTRGKIGLAVLGVVAAIGVATAATGGGSTTTATPSAAPGSVPVSSPPSPPARVTGCATDRALPGVVNVTGTYRAADAASSVTITGEVADARGHRLAEFDAITNNLGAGQVWKWDATASVTGGKVPAKVTCRVVKVDAF